MALGDRVDAFIDKSDDGDDLDIPESVDTIEEEPQYRMISTDRIPVSKEHGKIWKSRKKAAWKKLEDNGDFERWDVAIQYYRADQMEKRADTDRVDNRDSGTRLTSTGKESENLVFANSTSLLPAVYAKNPKVEVNVEREDLKPFGATLKHLINVLLTKRSQPGVNLKPKARRAALMAVLTNYAYMEVGYTRKEDASETTLMELNTLAKQLASTKNKKKMAEIEGKLHAMEEKVDVLSPAGPWVKFRNPKDVLIDPDADTLDEARWLMIRDHLDTNYIKAVFGTADEDGKYTSIFEPSHVLKVSGNDGIGVDDDIANFSIFDTSGERSFKDYGYEDEESFKKGQRTQVWYVWDKATRRVYLFNDKDWKWPLWVFDDLYGFDDFFPLVPLEFYIDPTDYTARGEVTYYIDQQDALNQINNEVAKVRDFIVGKVVYNQNILGVDADKTVDAFLQGTNGKRAIGLNVPPETDLTKVFAPFMPQSAHALNTIVFDKEKTIQAVDRVSSVTNVMRGVEFKTNTTNDAVNVYQSNTQTRLDEKIDAIEEFVGQIAWKLAHVCVKNMEREDIARLLGEEHAAAWDQYKPMLEDLNAFFAIEVVGGSTQKATSQQKKQQAAQLGQILGQFASATPAAIIVALQVMEEAYDEVIITPKQWQFIMQSLTQQMQAQNGAPTKPQDGQAQEGKPQPGKDEEQAQGDPSGDALMQVEQIIDSLPPELKKEFAKLIASNLPIKKALAAIMQLAKQSNPG